MGEWFNRLFNQYQFVRRLLVLWAVFLITWVTFQVFSDMEKITAAVNTAFGMVTAILTTVIGHYQWSRSRDKDNASVDNG